MAISIVLTGCSSSPAFRTVGPTSEDKRACNEIMYLQDVYFENEINGIFYADEMSRQLKELRGRGITPDLKSVLDIEITIFDKLKPYEPGLQENEWNSTEIFDGVDAFCYKNFKIIGW